MLKERPGMAEDPQQQMGVPVVKLEKELPWGRGREDPSPVFLLIPPSNLTPQCI